MDYDIASLTFINDTSAYQAVPDEISARVPAHVSSSERLIDFLKESLGLPAYCGNSWDALSDVLRYWGDWRLPPPRRVVILHSDLPFLQESRNGWFDLKNYVEVLISSITVLQEKNAAETDPLEQRELVAIFPKQMYEELYNVLNHPSAWDASIHCLGYSVASEFDPSWEVVHQYLQYLDGLTAENCILTHSEIGTLTITYNKHVKTYWVEYTSPDNEIWMLASQKDHSQGPSSGVSFELASHILETFFLHGERSSSVHWSILSFQDHNKLEDAYKLWYYRNEEEILLESTSGMAIDTIRQGLEQAGYNKEPAFSLKYWQEILIQPDALLLNRLTALCIIGFSMLPEATELLRPFLHSPVKQERWASARFLGMQQDEEALPILLSMLTDELPITGHKSGPGLDDYWYDYWRFYALRLLRKWQNPEVEKRLRESLAVWLQAEPQFDQDIATWRDYEQKLCYELGYRADLTALDNLSLEEERRQELLLQMERGYKVMRKNMTSQEEYEYLFHNPGL